MSYADDVLSFWFEELDPKDHFRSGPQVDETIRRRFMPVYEHVTTDFDLEAALASPAQALASVIVLDQFSRNMFRGTSRAFATDPLALRLAKSMVWRGLDRSVASGRRMFVYLPYEHSENLADQWACMRLMATLGDDKLTGYADAHRVIIERFGRFPHRNEALGRASSAEEIEFLNQPGSSF